ncbi:MAG TPA: NFACT family protein, partial [Candidatus Baltobacteraceae bacterium]
MLTDWLIVRRLGAELEAQLRSARVDDAGMLPDGRFALSLAGPAKMRRLLAFDPFGTVPMVTLEEPRPLLPQAGWPRALADALRGMRIEGVRSRHGDRLLAFELGARSRFGVASRLRLVVELVPKFGNILLLKDDVVIAAAKEFTAAQNARRSVTVGSSYEPPPLPQPPAGAVSLADVLARIATSDEDRNSAVKALRAAVPLLPLLLAQSLVAQASPADGAQALIDRAQAAVGSETGSGLAPIFVYREQERIVAVYTQELYQFNSAICTREPRLLDVLHEIAAGSVKQQSAGAAEARFLSLHKRLARRLDELARERVDRERERVEAGEAELVQRRGTALYAHLGEIAPGATHFVPPSDPALQIELDPLLDAKENAALFFRRYRKMLAKGVHVERRLGELALEE